MWISYNSSDDLLIVTNKWVRTFGIELNNYLKVIKIKDYDEEIKDVAVLKKDDSVSWVVCLGVESIIVYDAGQGKIERIQYNKSSRLNGDAMYIFILKIVCISHRATMSDSKFITISIWPRIKILIHFLSDQFQLILSLWIA